MGVDLVYKYIRRPLYRIKIMWEYLKQGYKTELWDWEYLLEDIKWKLQLMKQQFEKDQSWCELDKEIKQIEEIIKTIEKYKQSDCIGTAWDNEIVWRNIWVLLHNNLRNFWD